MEPILACSTRKAPFPLRNLAVLSQPFRSSLTHLRKSSPFSLPYAPWRHLETRTQAAFRTPMDKSIRLE